MSVPSPDTSLDPALVAESRIYVTTRVLRTAAGDPALASQIRGMMWAEYCDAGAPLGVSEDGMYVWWTDALAAPVA